MSNSLTALYLSNPELANALRKQQTGQALMQQGMDSSPIQSPWQGVSRLAAALVGGYETGQADRQFKEAGDRSKQESADFFKAVQDAMGGWQPAQPAAPMAGPVSQTPLAPAEMAPLIDAAAKERGMPPSLATALFATESNFNPTARNPRSGAYGLGQVLASTMANPGYGMQPTTEAELSDPRKAIPWSLDYLKARGGALGVTDWNDPQQQARALRAYGENTDEYVNKVQSRMGQPVPPAAGQGAPQGSPVAGMDPRQMQMLAMRAAQSNNPRIQAMAPMLMQMAKGEDTTKILPPGGELRNVRGDLIARNTTVSPNTVLTNDMRGPGAYEQKIGQDLANETLSWRKRGESAYGEIRNLDRMLAALDQFQTGVGSDTVIKAGQLAQRLGVPSATLGALGMKPEEIAQGEQIRAIGNQLVMGALGNREFPANNFSDADRRFMTAAYPGLANSPEGNRIMIAVQKAIAQRNIEIADAWRQWRGKNGSGLDSAQRFADEMLPGILAKDVLVPAAREGGWQEITPTAAPGPAANLPVIRDPSEAARLPPGTPFQTPDGRTLRVPAR